MPKQRYRPEEIIATRAWRRDAGGRKQAQVMKTRAADESRPGAGPLPRRRRDAGTRSRAERARADRRSSGPRTMASGLKDAGGARVTGLCQPLPGVGRPATLHSAHVVDRQSSGRQSRRLRACRSRLRAPRLAHSFATRGRCVLGRQPVRPLAGACLRGWLVAAPAPMGGDGRYADRCRRHRWLLPPLPAC